MLDVGLTRVVFPLVRLVQLPLEELVVLLVLRLGGGGGPWRPGRRFRERGGRLVRQFNRCGEPVIRPVKAKLSGDQPLLAYVESRLRGRSTDRLWVVTEGLFEQLLLVIELGLHASDLPRHLDDEATELFDVPIFGRNCIREAHCIASN